MVEWQRTNGQAAVEMVALLPLAMLLLAGAWQLAIAGHAMWSAESAAGVAARASAIGADARAAARSRVPDARSLRVRSGGDGTVEVSLAIPTVLGLPGLGRVSGTAHFEPQR
jgi:Flp pilus assembly protein TadG